MPLIYPTLKAVPWHGLLGVAENDRRILWLADDWMQMVAVLTNDNEDIRESTFNMSTF